MTGSDAQFVIPFPSATANRTLRIHADMGVTVEATNRVTAVADQSGTLANFIAGTGTTARPTLISNAYGARSCIRFDGAANVLTCTSLLSSLVLASGYTVYLIHKNGSPYVRQLHPDGDGAVIADVGGYWLRSSDVAEEVGAHYSSSVYVPRYVAGAAGTLRYSRFKLDSGTMSLKVGLTGTPSTTSAGTIDVLSNSLHIGAAYSNSLFLAMDLCELVVYRRATTSQEDLDHEAYFAHQWPSAA